MEITAVVNGNVPNLPFTAQGLSKIKYIQFLSI